MVNKYFHNLLTAHRWLPVMRPPIFFIFYLLVFVFDTSTYVMITAIACNKSIEKMQIIPDQNNVDLLAIFYLLGKRFTSLTNNWKKVNENNVDLREEFVKLVFYNFKTF